MNPARRAPLLALATAIAALAAGCGGATGASGSSTAAHTGAIATNENVTVVALRSGVRTAIRADLQLSIYVLWHNHIPGWATSSTRGPALAALRSSAATRKRQGIQIKNLSGHLTIVSIALAPSDMTASAIIRDQRRVAPYESGRRLGRAISGSDNSRLQLHRLGSTARFVVWSVSPLK